MNIVQLLSVLVLSVCLSSLGAHAEDSRVLPTSVRDM